MSSRLVPAALLLLGSPIAITVAAETSSTNDDAIVITAARVAQTVDAALAPVTVITRQDIERSQAQSVVDLLRGQPGISISNNGGQGKTSSLFLRGTNSDHVLVLLDGQKIGSATTGTAAFQDLPVELVERVEIVRGARSSLYGSEAIGGVIQIFTRKGSDTLKPTLALGVGSYGTAQGSTTLSGGSADGQAWYSLGLSGFATDGFNACRGSTRAGCYTVEPDRDGYRNQSARLRAGWRITPDAQAEVNLLRADGQTRFDGSSVNAANTRQQLLGATLTLAPLAGWQTVLRAGQSQDNADNLKNGVFKSRFDTRRDNLSWQNDFTLTPGQQLVAGLDWLNDRVDSTTRYARDTRNDRGLFAQYLGQFGRHDVQLAARHDADDQFGGKNTHNAAWGYAFGNDLRLTAAWSSAFKAPTFNQLYYPGFGNAALRPENSHGVDLGLAGKTGISRWSLNAYATRVTGLIGYDASYAPVNIDSALLRGIELVAAANVAEWNLQGNLSLSDPRNQAAGGNYGKELPRRARENLALSADRALGGSGNWNLGATLRAEGRRYDDLANRTRLGGYATTDLRLEYRLDKCWRVQARVENLGDKHYETAYLFNQPGRGVYLTLRYQP